MSREPVLSVRQECDQKRVVERFGLVRRAGGNDENLAFADGDVFGIHVCTKRALKDVQHLFVRVGVNRHERALFEIGLRQGGFVARHGLSRDHFRDFFQRQVVPPVEPSAGRHCSCQEYNRAVVPGPERPSRRGLHE